MFLNKEEKAAVEKQREKERLNALEADLVKVLTRNPETQGKAFSFYQTFLDAYGPLSFKDEVKRMARAEAANIVDARLKELQTKKKVKK